MNPVLRLWDGYPHTSEQLQPEVRALQESLNQHGAAISVDGYFGPGTVDAVIEFQRRENLHQDGIVGPQTWEALTGEKPAQSWTTYSASNVAMQLDAKAAQKYTDHIHAAATIAQVPVSIICGIGSRESHWGRALRPSGPGGTGDRIRRNNMRKWRTGPLPDDGGGFGRGLMQIDYDAHEFARTGPWHDPAKNIQYGGQVLADNIRYFQKRGSRDLMRCAIAAYNCGAGNVRRAIDRGRDIDYYTAHRDYSANVLDRAAWFEMVGWT